MKVLITGHTKGLGAILFQRYQKLGHTMYGFSKSTGHDLTRREAFDQCVAQAVECELVINNAPGPFQASLLERLLQKQQMQTIVNISSMASRYGISRSPSYAAHKASMDMLSLSHSQIGPRWPASILVRPGYFTGERSKTKPGPHVDVWHVADIVMHAVDYAVSDVARIHELSITA